MGAYQLLERIGEGGMGEVWKAKHRFLARPAAVKLIRPDALAASDSDALLQRFAREAQATASLVSPHTVQVFDFGFTDDQTFYYVMELLDGLNLHTLVRKHGPRPAGRVLSARPSHQARPWTSPVKTLKTSPNLAESHAPGVSRPPLATPPAASSDRRGRPSRRSVPRTVARSRPRIASSDWTH